MKEKAYHEKINIENELKLREIIKSLPYFCKDFFIGIEPTTSSRTRIAYAYDLRVFFEYIHDNNPIYQKIELPDFPLMHMTLAFFSPSCTRITQPAKNMKLPAYRFPFWT